MMPIRTLRLHPLFALACSVGVVVAGCGPVPLTATAARATFDSTEAVAPAVILQSLGEDTGCSAAPGAKLVLNQNAVARIDVGATDPVYIVDTGKVGCSIPTNRPSAEGSLLEIWHGPKTSLKRDDQSFSVLTWAAGQKSVVGLADPAYCDDAVFDAKGDFAAGACGYSITWDATAGAIAIIHKWNAAARTPAPIIPLAIPPQHRKLASQTAGCEAYNGSQEVGLPGFVTDYDVNGDGNPDTILDYSHLRCATGSPGLCGTGGCTIQVLLNDAKGGYVTGFNEQALGWRIPRTGLVEMAVHGGLCGRTGAQPCMTTLTWFPAKARFETSTTPTDYYARAASPTR